MKLSTEVCKWITLRPWKHSISKKKKKCQLRKRRQPTVGSVPTHCMFSYLHKSTEWWSEQIYYSKLQRNNKSGQGSVSPEAPGTKIELNLMKRTGEPESCFRGVGGGERIVTWREQVDAHVRTLYTENKKEMSSWAKPKDPQHPPCCSCVVLSCVPFSLNSFWDRVCLHLVQILLKTFGLNLDVLRSGAGLAVGEGRGPIMLNKCVFTSRQRPFCDRDGTKQRA